MLRSEYAQLKQKAEFAGKSSAQVKIEAEQKKSLVDPNMKSKIAKRKDSGHSSSDSEVRNSLFSVNIILFEIGRRGCWNSTASNGLQSKATSKNIRFS